MHFARWLAWWQAAVDDRHAGPKPEVVKVQAGRIAAAMSGRIIGVSPTRVVAGDDETLIGHSWIRVFTTYRTVRLRRDEF